MAIWNPTQTERDLVEATNEIGKIAGWAAWATAELAELIAKKRKPVSKLTVAELLAIKREYDAGRERKQRVMHVVKAMQRAHGPN